mmetsp:Transcript_12998/g.29611  ORF Transcript_12998/g.29611 Transcript_12998/m.29611 type:complete len:204 (-) Transcript_12998:1281-1892(-)
MMIVAFSLGVRASSSIGTTGVIVPYSRTDDALRRRFTPSTKKLTKCLGEYIGVVPGSDGRSLASSPLASTRGRTRSCSTFHGVVFVVDDADFALTASGVAFCTGTNDDIGTTNRIQSPRSAALLASSSPSTVCQTTPFAETCVFGAPFFAADRSRSGWLLASTRPCPSSASAITSMRPRVCQAPLSPSRSNFSREMSLASSLR